MHTSIIDVFAKVIERLESDNIPYMVVGSVAAMIYGEPRLTHDMDLVIDLQPVQAGRFEKLFPLEEFYCPPLEVLRAEVVQRGQFNLVHHDSGLKIDLIVRKDSPHGREEFARRRRLPFWEGLEAYLATPEDVILKKLVYHREGGSQKHLTDIRGILAQTDVNRTYLNEWVERLGLAGSWDLVGAG